MVKTLRVSDELWKHLSNMKQFEREPIENVLWDLIEDRLELSEETKKELEESYTEIKEGKTIPAKEVYKRLGLC